LLPTSDGLLRKDRPEKGLPPWRKRKKKKRLPSPLTRGKAFSDYSLRERIKKRKPPSTEQEGKKVAGNTLLEEKKKKKVYLS